MILNAVSAVLQGADLEAALLRAGPTNDMLPPRADDRVAGRIGARFTAALSDQLGKGDYRPSRGSAVFVPKTRFATRPAMLLTLQDRIVFEAIVEPMRPKIEKYLVSTEVALWPRGLTTDKKWHEFEESPLAQGGGYVVLTDVAGFYESIQHDRLGAELVKAGVRRADVDALEVFLRDVMGERRGLPQGIATSDALATLYLADADHSIRRTDLPYVRHGDDMRISVPTWHQAREALHTVEAALRRAGLLMNASKVRVLKLSTYRDHLADLEKTRSGFTARLAKAREEAVRNGEFSDVIELMQAAGMSEDMQWGFGYHGEIDIDEVIAALRDHIAPSVTEVIEEIFRDAMKHRPDKDGGLSRDVWHARLVWSLRRLAAARSTAAIAHAADLLMIYPEETQNVCNYLLAVVDGHPAEVVNAVEFPLRNAGFILGWQYGWLYRVLSRAPLHVSPSILDAALGQMRTEGDWLARIEAARLAARRGVISGSDANLLLANAPEAFRTDIIAIAAGDVGEAAWVQAFLDGARQDALSAVVLDALKAQPGPT